MQEGTLPVLEWTFLQPVQRIIMARSPAARGRSHWRDTHAASQGRDVSRASAAPGEPISEQLWSEGLQHTQGSVLEQGKARGGSCSYPGVTTAPLSQHPGGAGNEGLEWSLGKGGGGEEFLGVPLLSPSKSSLISNK